MKRRCPWCLRTFDLTAEQRLPHSPPKIYCSPKCKKKANALSQRVREAVPTTTCPTPDKRGYTTQLDAEKVLNQKPYLFEGTHPYACVCGQFHIGHVQALKKKMHVPTPLSWVAS